MNTALPLQWIASKSPGHFVFSSELCNSEQSCQAVARTHWAGCTCLGGERGMGGRVGVEVSVNMPPLAEQSLNHGPPHQANLPEKAE